MHIKYVYFTVKIHFVLLLGVQYNRGLVSNSSKRYIVLKKLQGPPSHVTTIILSAYLFVNVKENLIFE